MSMTQGYGSQSCVREMIITFLSRFIRQHHRDYSHVLRARTVSCVLWKCCIHDQAFMCSVLQII